jgi:hypothetical protein
VRFEVSGNIIDLQKAAEEKASGAKIAETAETKSKRELLQWADDIASKSIAAARTGRAIRFLNVILWR